MVTRPGYRYSCPPNRARGGEGPWCDGLPCPGHRATNAQVAAAKVIAWCDGWTAAEWFDPREEGARREYLAVARRALHELGPGLGTPR